MSYGLVRNKQCRGAARDFNQYLDSHPEAEAKLVADYGERYAALMRQKSAKFALDVAIMLGVGYVIGKGIKEGASQGAFSGPSRPGRGETERKKEPPTGRGKPSEGAVKTESRNADVDLCDPVNDRRTHDKGETKGYEFKCPDGAKVYVWWSTERSKWVGDSNYASLLGGVGYRDTPEAAASWECGCKD